MSHDLYEYGTTNPIFFKITLNGAAVTGLPIDNNDYKVSLDDGATFANASTIGVVAECAGGFGWYKWTPTAAGTQAEVIIFNVKDNVGSGVFDENGLVIATGGNASARFKG